MPTSRTTTRPPKPSRPARIDPVDLAEAMAATSCDAQEIRNVERDVDGRLIITHGAGNGEGQPTVTVYCPPEAPDAEGKTGLLHDEVRSGIPYRTSWAIGLFADPHRPSERGDWTIADLDLEADRLLAVMLPAPTGGPYGPTRLPWVGQHPIRARAVWLDLARQLGVTPVQAAQYHAEAAHCRAVILGSGWLGRKETDRL
jgi:hypothetical protein